MKVASTTKVTKTANHTVYAHWSKRTFSVTLNPNGGTLLTDSVTVTLGTRYRSLPTPAKAGQHFNGWYTAKTGASVAATAVEQANEYEIVCTRMVELSNGTVRYYGVFPKISKTTSYWFTYSDEMFIN